MSMYDDFRDMENATVVIKGGTTWVEVEGGNPIQDQEEVFNNPGIFYKLSASEKVARQQIQKVSTHGLILDPELVTTVLTEKMTAFITTDDITDQEYRIVTADDPLNLSEAIILDLIRVE